MTMKYDTLKKILGGCALFVALVFLFQRQILFFLNPEYLVPDESTTWTLYVHKRHLFSNETVFPIKARHVDWRKEPDWCAQAKDGSWNSYFIWNDGF